MQLDSVVVSHTRALVHQGKDRQPPAWSRHKHRDKNSLCCFCFDRFWSSPISNRNRKRSIRVRYAFLFCAVQVPPAEPTPPTIQCPLVSFTLRNKNKNKMFSFSLSIPMCVVPYKDIDSVGTCDGIGGEKMMFFCTSRLRETFGMPEAPRSPSKAGHSRFFVGGGNNINLCLCTAHFHRTFFCFWCFFSLGLSLTCTYSCVSLG